MTGVFEANSVEETWALARQFAAELKRGDVVCLEGDLGAGKTTFTPGLAAALAAWQEGSARPVAASQSSSSMFCPKGKSNGRSPCNVTRIRMARFFDCPAVRWGNKNLIVRLMLKCLLNIFIKRTSIHS